jgi:hypothetical protein
VNTHQVACTIKLLVIVIDDARKRNTGNNNRKGRLSTFDLLMKVTRFAKKKYCLQLGNGGIHLGINYSVSNETK